MPSFFFFFFNDTATTEIYTLSLHDALPISQVSPDGKWVAYDVSTPDLKANKSTSAVMLVPAQGGRSEEHTSELQSQSNLVCRLLLEKKKKNIRLYTRSVRKQRIAGCNIVRD